MWKILYTKKALENLENLDKKIAKRIVEKIEFFSYQKNPLRFAKNLKDTRLGEYRFRIGDYRVLFDVNCQGEISIMLILSIKHRREVYNI